MTTDQTTARCPYCFKAFEGDLEAGIQPGDELVDHLTDEHDVFSAPVEKGLYGEL